MANQWTVMVYMAGDNGKLLDGTQLMADLQQYGWLNISEMAEIGSTDRVTIVAQYDTLEEQSSTPRLFIDGKSRIGEVVGRIPPVNTGDPANLTDFIVWATSAYPAECYALVLWNHGTGWKEEDIYARYRDRVARAIRRGETRASAGRRMLRTALFLSTVAEIMSIEDDEIRGICYDDTSMDFLDSQKLAQALIAARVKTRCALSVLGMDACLMSTVEVAYQMRPFANYLVGSQEVEMAYGWPYKRILGELVQHPSMTPGELSKLIVEQFGAHYLDVARDGGGANTQSAIDLRAISKTFAKVEALSESIAKTYPLDHYTRLAVHRARSDAQSFEDKESLDLRHFAEILSGEYEGIGLVGQQADDIAQHLHVASQGGPIIANFRGRERPHANGLSIYLPAYGCSSFYERQAFSMSGWLQVIRTVNQPPNPTEGRTH